jgi:nucleoside-triphosphatase
MEKSKVFIITGEQGAGKTTRLTEIVELLKPVFPDIFGFYAFGEWEDGLRKLFHIVDIQKGESHLLCTRKGRTANSRGAFVFIQQTIEKGEKIVLEGINQKGGLAIIDEIGRFELEGKVWYNIFNKLIISNFPVLITVRENTLEKVIRYFGIEHPVIFTLAEDNATISQNILENLLKK